MFWWNSVLCWYEGGVCSFCGESADRAVAGRPFRGGLSGGGLDTKWPTLAEQVDRLASGGGQEKWILGEGGKQFCSIGFSICLGFFEDSKSTNLGLYPQKWRGECMMLLIITKLQYTYCREIT